MAIANMEYERMDDQIENASRAGLLHTSFGTFKMPSFSASVRRRFEAEAYLRNLNAGMEPQVISPQASYRNQFFDLLGSLSGNGLLSLRPLIMPDPESEALNFNCLARNNYKKLDEKILPRTKSKEEVIDILFNTGLSGGQDWNDVHSSWRKVQREYGFSPLVNWMARHLRGTMSDVMLVPTPIVRSSVSTIPQFPESHQF